MAGPVNDQYLTDRCTASPALPFFLQRQEFRSGRNGPRNSGIYRHVDFYALYIVHAGTGLHVIDGHPYAVARGDVYMTAPGASHEYQRYAGLQADAFCFQLKLFSEVQQEALRALPGFSRLFVSGLAGNEEHFHLSPQALAHADSMVRELRDELPPARDAWPNGDPVSMALVPALMFRLLAWLARERTRSLNRSHEDGANGESMAEVLRYCETHFANEITVSQLAARLYVTPSHFGKLFRRATGTSPAAYIRRLRLESAQELLKSSDLSLSHIARESGLGNGAQLARAFRAAFGQTPSEYRGMFKVVVSDG